MSDTKVTEDDMRAARETWERGTPWGGASYVVERDVGIALIAAGRSSLRAEQLAKIDGLSPGERDAPTRSQLDDAFRKARDPNAKWDDTKPTEDDEPSIRRICALWEKGEVLSRVEVDALVSSCRARLSKGVTDGE